MYTHIHNFLGLELQQRDVDVFESIWTHGFMSSPQLQRLFFPSRGSSQRRFTQLVNASYLYRFHPDEFSRHSPYVFTLTRQAVNAVPQLNLSSQTPSAFWRMWKSPMRLHRLQVAEVHVQLSEGARISGASFRWFNPLERRNEFGQGLVPDGFAVSQLGNQQLRLIVEMDRGTEKQSVLADKVRRYLSYRQRTTSDPWLLFVFESTGRERQFLKRFSRVSGIRILTAVLGVERLGGSAWAGIFEPARQPLWKKHEI